MRLKTGPRTSLAIVLAAGFLLMGSALNAKDIYVSPTGNDGNSGASSSVPLRSIATAARAAAAGDTVWLMPGQYPESIVPQRSGASGRPITFRGVEPGSAVIKAPSGGTEGSGIYINQLDYIVIDGVGVNGSNPAPKARVKHFAKIINANFVTIRHGVFKFANGWGGIDVSKSSHVVIEDNDLDMVGEYQKTTKQDGEGSGDVIYMRYGPITQVLVQRNRVRHGGHDLLRLDGQHSIVQDNDFDNNWADRVGGEAGYRSVSLGGSDNVFQRNYVSNAGIGPPTHRYPPLMKVEGSNNIARYNVLAYGQSHGILSAAANWTVNGDGSRIYNNTFYHLGGGAWIMRAYANHTIRNYIFKNNLVIESRLSPRFAENDADVYFAVASGGLGPTAGSVVVGNLFGPSNGQGGRVYSDGGGGYVRLDEAQQRFPALFVNNKLGKADLTTPRPVAYSNFDLKSGSAGVDQGTFLTTVVSDGRSKRVPVDDARFFSDGFGIGRPDQVQLAGTSEKVAIQDIDHATSTLILEREVAFSKGQGIGLVFSGSRPDVGAHESNIIDLPLPKPPVSLRTD